MKVVFYIHSLCVGGTEKIITDYLLRLKQYGVNVVLVVNYHTDTFLEREIIEAGIKIYALNTPLSFNHVIRLLQTIKRKFIINTKKLNKILKAEVPDVLHINTALEKIIGFEFPAKMVFYSFHCDIARYIRLSKPAGLKELKRLAKAGMNFFALTDRMAEDIKKSFYTDRVQKLPNGVDLNKIRAARYDRKLFLPLIGIPENAFVLGHTGRFHSVKNHERIIDIFRALHERRADSYLILIGGDVDGRMEAIKNRVESYGLGNYVKFLGVRHDAVAVTGCFDAFVLPSFEEGFSLALVEAQALNIRSVASDRVPQDVVCNKNCFRLSLKKTDEEWAELLLSDSVHSDEKDIENFDLSNVTKTLLEYYKSVVEEQNLR